MSTSKVATTSPQEKETTAHTRPGTAAIYIALMKPKIIVLLLITTLGAMFVAAKGVPTLAVSLWTMLGGTLSAGGANALNHYIDRDIDGQMYRTKKRPVPSGWIQPRAVIIFGIILTILAFAIFATQVNLLSAILSLLGSMYYIFIYTIWLKRRTYHNVTIGGVAGAIPTLVGWSAVTGTLAPMAWLLFMIVFLWTPPHTWALTLVVERDYARVGVPMMPVVLGENETRRQITIYSWVFFLVTLSPLFFRQMGYIYFAGALITGYYFLRGAYRLKKMSTRESALSLYKFSLLHLALLFGLMVADVHWRYLLDL